MTLARRNASQDRLLERRRAVQHCLEEYGFGRKGLAKGATRLEANDSLAPFAKMLQALGPVFASFGLYLSSRPDLIPLTGCVELAEIKNRSPATALSEVRKIIQRELPTTSEDALDQPQFGRFDPKPFESRLLSQLHCGELDNGDQVVVAVVHPNIELERELNLLPLLSQVLTPLLGPSQQVSVFHDFRNVVAEQLNLERAAEWMDLLTNESRDKEAIRVPHVYRHLCSRNVLVTERLAGMRLDTHIASEQGKSAADVRFSRGVVAEELARLLCDIWLRHAFEGSVYPVALRTEDVLIRSPTEIAIVGGTFGSLPSVSRRNLLDYLIYVATDEPSKALQTLLLEQHTERTHASAAQLDRQFRQIVPSREGGWEDGGLTNCLSDTLFAQWRLLGRSGYTPQRHLLSLYRGTFHIASITRQVSCDRDSLLEGVKDLRLTKLLNDIATTLEPSYWGGQIDRLASLMILGPQHLDAALKQVSDQQTTDHHETRSTNRKAPKLLIAVLLSMLAIVVLHRRGLVDVESSGTAICFLFLALGGFALHLLISSDR